MLRSWTPDNQALAEDLVAGLKAHEKAIGILRPIKIAVALATPDREYFSLMEDAPIPLDVMEKYQGEDALVYYRDKGVSYRQLPNDVFWGNGQVMTPKGKFVVMWWAHPCKTETEERERNFTSEEVKAIIKKVVRARFEGRWDWCTLCDSAVVTCLACCNSSCNGGGCDQCKADWDYLSAVEHEYYPKKEELPDPTALRQEADYRQFMLRRWCKGVEGVEHSYVQWIDPDRGPSDSLLQCPECRGFESVKGEGWYVLTTYEDWVRHCQNWNDLEKL